MPSCETVLQNSCWLTLACSTLSLCLALQTDTSSAQQLGIPIQLPTTSVFSVNTTVSVPDGGAISLGGNSGNSWSSTRRGGPFRPFGNRAIGATQFASNASVHVQIISLAEMEADLLSQLPGDRSLEDYARPATPALTVQQAPNSGAAQKLSPTSLPDRTTSQAESRSNSQTHSAKQSSQQSAESEVTPTSKSRFTTEVVDPNGSKQVQDKADFMSRHIGRKKK